MRNWPIITAPPSFLPGSANPRTKPRSKSGVQIVQRFILAGLRNRTFFSLAEANAAIRERLVLLNNRPFRKLPGCRQSRFEETGPPGHAALAGNPLRVCPVEEGPGAHRLPCRGRRPLLQRAPSPGAANRWMSATPRPRWSASTRETGLPPISSSSAQGETHHRPRNICPRPTGSMPSGPRRGSSPGRPRPGRLRRRVVENILSRKAYPEHGFRSCMGIISLGKRYRQRTAGSGL